MARIYGKLVLIFFLYTAICTMYGFTVINIKAYINEDRIVGLQSHHSLKGGDPILLAI